MCSPRRSRRWTSFTVRVPHGQYAIPRAPHTAAAGIVSEWQLRWEWTLHALPVVAAGANAASVLMMLSRPSRRRPIPAAAVRITFDCDLSAARSTRCSTTSRTKSCATTWTREQEHAAQPGLFDQPELRRQSARGRPASGCVLEIKPGSAAVAARARGPRAPAWSPSLGSAVCCCMRDIASFTLFCVCLRSATYSSRNTWRRGRRQRRRWRSLAAARAAPAPRPASLLRLRRSGAQLAYNAAARLQQQGDVARDRQP